MAFDAHANFASSTVASAPTPASSGTSLTVASGDGTKFPTAPFNCVVCPAGSQPTQTNAEVVRVTNVVGDVFTVTRSQESSSPINIGIGYSIFNAPTIKAFTDIESLVLQVPELSTCQAVSKTNVTLSGLQTIDSYALQSGDLVLAVGQVTRSQNGPWVASSGAWTRPAQYASGATIGPGRTVSVAGGSVYGLTHWVLQTSGTVTVGSTATTWLRHKPGTGLIATPEQFGAARNGVPFGDGKIQAGSVTLSSSTITSSIAASMNVAASAGSSYVAYLPWGGPGASAGVTNGAVASGAVGSIPRTGSTVPVPAGPFIISSGSSAQLFWAAASGAPYAGNITLVAGQSVSGTIWPTGIPNGATISFGNTGLSTTIVSATTGSCTFAASAAQTVNSCGWGMYGSDDQAAIKSAADAAWAVGGELELGPGMYVVSGSLNQTHSNNSLIPLYGIGVGLRIQGQKAMDSDSWSTFLGTGTLTGSSVIATTRINDTFDATNGPPSVIGGPNLQRATQDFTGPTVTLSNFSILLPENPAICGIDLSRCLGGKIEGVVSIYSVGKFDGAPYGCNGQMCTNSYQFGLMMPCTSNGGLSMIDRFAAGGSYLNLMIAEHTSISSAYAANSVAGLALPAGLGNGHTSNLGYVDIEGVNYGICGFNAANRIDGTGGTGTATVTSASPTVVDTQINSCDKGKLVTGVGIPANTYVGTVIPGTSFLLSSSPLVQITVNATSNGTAVTIAGGVQSPVENHWVVGFLDYEDQGNGQWSTTQHVLDANNTLIGQFLFYRWSNGVQQSLAPTSIGGQNLRVEAIDPTATRTFSFYNVAGTSTWTKPSSCTAVDVTVIGAGGSGATGTSGAAAVQVGGGGGGGGGRTHATFNANDLPATVTVTVGAGGLGVTGTTGAATNGNDGGPSSFGSYVSARGGKGATGRTGGATGGGQCNGSTGQTASATGAAGSSIPTNDGTGPGGGGAGGGVASGPTATSGGAGTGSGDGLAGGAGNLGSNGGSGTSVATLTARTDTVVVTNGSPWVADTSIGLDDQWSSVAGTGIPASTYVGTVQAGVGFLLSSSTTTQTNVNATNNGVSVTVTDLKLALAGGGGGGGGGSTSGAANSSGAGGIYGGGSGGGGGTSHSGAQDGGSKAGAGGCVAVMTW